MSALRNRKRDDAVSRATRTDCLMAADPGLVVREGLEALGIPELHSFLLRLGVDGRGLSPDDLCDIALEALELRPQLVQSAWQRAIAGAPVPARSGRPWDAEAFARRQDVAQPSWPAASDFDGYGSTSGSSHSDAGGGGSGSTTGTDVSGISAGGHSVRSESSGRSASSDRSDASRGESPVPHGGSQLRAEFSAEYATAMQERLERLEAMLTPEARYEYMAQVACEPPMRHILAGKLSEADVRKVRAYPIGDAEMDELVEHGIVPPGFPDPEVLFSDGAFRLDSALDDQLPMPALQRDLIEQHLSVPVGWPERATHYSHVPYEEFQLYEPKDKKAIESYNDDVQRSMWELRDVIYVSYTLVDKSRTLDERVAAVMRFFEVQARLLYDDIAHAEAGKQAINDTYVGGGLRCQKRSADSVRRTGPNITSDARRVELSAKVASLSTINAAKATYAAATARGLPSPAGARTAATKAKKDAADEKLLSTRKSAAEKRAEKAKRAAKDKDKDKDKDKGGRKCYACGEVGHQHSDCKNKPAGWKPSTPPSGGDAAKPARVSGSTAAASPSHESDGYVPDSAADPPDDRGARAANRAADRRVSRTSGGQ